MPATTLSTGISTTSYLNTPQAKDDAYVLYEGYGLDDGLAGSNVVYFNVMLNDLGGNAKTLYSVDDVNNNNDSVSGDDLLVKDASYANFGAVTVWETSQLGAKFAIVNGQIAYDTTPVTGLIDALGPTQSLTDTLTYAIRLGNGTLSTATVTITIKGANDAPVITSDGGGNEASLSISENTKAVTTVTATDADPGTTLKYSIVGGADASFFTIDEDTGALSFKSAPDYEAHADAGGNNIYDVIVQASDGTLSDTQTLHVKVTNVDEVAPVFDSGTTADAIDENSGTGQVVYVAAATDPATDGPSNPVTYSLGGTDAAAFSIDSNTGEVTLTGNPDYEGQSSYSFDVTATDAAGNATTQTVSLSINNLDEVAPVFDSGTTADAVDENSGAGQVVYVAAATDPATDGPSNPVTYSLGGTDAGAFSIDGATGKVTLTVNPDFEGQSSYSFDVTATDAAGNATTQTVSLLISNLDEVAPVFTSGTIAAAIDENSGAGQIIYDADATDPAADGGPSNPVTYSLGGTGAGAFTIDGAAGKVTLTGNPDFEGQSSYSFDVTATDAAGNAATQTVTLNINNLDEVAPIFSSGTTAAAIDENSGAGQVVYDADATDPAADGGPSNPVTYSLGGTDAGGFSIAADGKVTLTVNPDFEGQSSYSFDVTATDAAGNATTQTVTLNINNLDEVAPIFSSDTTADAIDENSGAGQVVYVAAATDPAADGGPSNPVTYSLGGTDAGAFSIDANTGEVTLTGNPDFEGQSSYSFEVTATDAAGNAATQTVTLNISNLDEVAPVFDSGTTADAIDENSGAGQVVYVAAATDPAADGGPSNPVTYSLGGTDAAAFSVDFSTGEVTLTGNPDHEGQSSYSFDVTAADAAGNATTQTVSLLISNLDEAAPVFGSGTTADAIDENSGAGQVVYVAAATDPAADGGPSNPVTYSLGGADALAFSIDANTGEVTLTDNPDFEGQSSYSFEVTATDAAGNATTQTVSLSIANLDEVAPVFSSGTTAAAINENSGAGQIIYDADATDPAADDGPSNPVTYSLGGTDAGAFSIAADGKVTLTGNPDFEGQSSYSFDVTATDAAGNAATQTVTLNINNLDEVAPVFSSGTTAAAINENSGAGQIIYDADATDPAADGGPSSPVTYSLGGVDAALFSIAADGKVTLTGNPDYETKPSYSFDVTATDAAGNATTQTVSLAINDVAENTPPVIGALSANTISEVAQKGTVVGTVAASDDKPGYSFSLTDDAGGRFAINVSTGQITLADSSLLDFESFTSHSVMVKVTDSDGVSASKAFTINVSDFASVASFTGASGATNDTVDGTSAGNSLDGGNGDDLLYGGKGDDTLIGGGGNDRLFGQDGNDSLSGDNAADFVLHGGAGVDTLDGGNGIDLLIGGTGADKMTGGGATDSFRFLKGDLGTGVDSITDFDATEKLQIGDLLTGFGLGSNLADFVKATTVSGNTTIAIDADGAAGGASFVDLVVLQTFTPVTLSSIVDTSAQGTV